jgi:SET domain-containing protein
VFIKAAREIEAGEEVFVDYGFDYWLSFYECQK